MAKKEKSTVQAPAQPLVCLLVLVLLLSLLLTLLLVVVVVVLLLLLLLLVISISSIVIAIIGFISIISSNGQAPAQPEKGTNLVLRGLEAELKPATKSRLRKTCIDLTSFKWTQSGSESALCRVRLDLRRISSPHQKTYTDRAPMSTCSACQKLPLMLYHVVLTYLSPHIYISCESYIRQHSNEITDITDIGSRIMSAQTGSALTCSTD